MTLRLPTTSPGIYPSPIVLSPQPDSSTKGSSTTCLICHNAPSAYTCPTCNIPYCSLKCYKDENKHRGCLGQFQKRQEKEVRESVVEDEEEQEIEQDEQKQEDKRKLLDMIKKWHISQSNSNDDPGIDWNSLMQTEEDEDEDESGSEIDADDQDLKLPSTEAELLGLLDEDQRRVFMEAVANQNQPQKAEQLWRKIARSGLKADQTTNEDSQSQGPWWASDKPESAQPPKLDADFRAAVYTLCESRSTSCSISPAFGVIWNLIAVLLSYTYILTHLDIPTLHSEDEDISRQVFTQLVPFLTSSTSKILLSSPSEITMYIYTTLGDSHRSTNPTQLLVYLYDKAITLLSESKVQDDHQEEDNVLLALNDVHNLFTNVQIRKKIIFYASQYLLLRKHNQLEDKVTGQPLETTVGGGGRKRRKNVTMTLQEELCELQQELIGIQDDERYAVQWSLLQQQQQRSSGTPMVATRSSRASALIQPVKELESENSKDAPLLRDDGKDQNHLLSQESRHARTETARVAEQNDPRQESKEALRKSSVDESKSSSSPVKEPTPAPPPHSKPKPGFKAARDKRQTQSQGMGRFKPSHDASNRVEEDAK
ncbi:unnamed protein product [Sympodiomycopsis kandeliae]